MFHVILLIYGYEPNPKGESFVCYGTIFEGETGFWHAVEDFDGSFQFFRVPPDLVVRHSLNLEEIPKLNVLDLKERLNAGKVLTGRNWNRDLNAWYTRIIKECQRG